MNPVPWLQMTNMISYQGLVRTFLKVVIPATPSKYCHILIAQMVVQLTLLARGGMSNCLRLCGKAVSGQIWSNTFFSIPTGQ